MAQGSRYHLLEEELMNEIYFGMNYWIQNVYSTQNYLFHQHTLIQNVCIYLKGPSKLIIKEKGYGKDQ